MCVKKMLKNFSCHVFVLKSIKSVMPLAQLLFYGSKLPLFLYINIKKKHLMFRAKAFVGKLGAKKKSSKHRISFIFFQVTKDPIYIYFYVLLHDYRHWQRSFSITFPRSENDLGVKHTTLRARMI